MTDMTAQPAANSTENVGRGTLFALGAIPVAIVAFAIVGAIGFISGIVAVVIPSIAGWLYVKGAGAPLTRKGWAPFILVSAAAIILGTLAGIAGSTYQAYSSVGGSGLTPVFWTTFGKAITNGGVDLAFAVLIGVGLGAAGIVGVVRGAGKFAGANTNRVAAQQPVTPVAYPTDAPAAPTAQTPVAPPAPPAAPVTPPAANAPSPGVMLNGKPVDPNAK